MHAQYLARVIYFLKINLITKASWLAFFLGTKELVTKEKYMLDLKWENAYFIDCDLYQINLFNLLEMAVELLRYRWKENYTAGQNWDVICISGNFEPI